MKPGLPIARRIEYKELRRINPEGCFGVLKEQRQIMERSLEANHG